jgi:hypothetical protein
LQISCLEKDPQQGREAAANKLSGRWIFRVDRLAYTIQYFNKYIRLYISPHGQRHRGCCHFQFSDNFKEKVVDEVGPFSAHKLSLGCKQF